MSKVERDPRLVEVAARAAAFFNGDAGFANNGRINLYRCERVGSHCIITVDREPGVTPFMAPCERCGDAVMRSAMYRVSQLHTPTHEWYRPDSLEGYSAATVEHLMNGGLLLRVIERTAK